MADAPNIRFKGFTGDWEQRKLGEIATFINGRAYSQDELLSSGKYKVLRVGNFYTNGSWYYSDMELEDKYYAEEGDLLYTWSASFGPHIWRGEKVIYHYHIWKVELSEYIEKRFAVQLLVQDNVAIQSDKNGSTMVHITKAGMEEKTVLLPSNIEEQSKIGACLDTLDHLITFYQCKCNNTKELKKYMLKKMFPQNGKSTPEIRFAGFTTDWDQRKLKDYCEMYNGDRSAKYPNASDMVEKGIPFINAGDLENGSVNLRTCNKISREKYNDLGGAKLQRGDIVYCLRGTLGKNAIIDVFNEGTVASSLVAIRPRNIDGKYLYYILNSDIEYCQRVVHDEGAAQPNLSAKSVSEFVIPVPSMEEQEKISLYFTNIDHLIALHQRKCDQLKEVKKFMLRNMFPQKG